MTRIQLFIALSVCLHACTSDNDPAGTAGTGGGLGSAANSGTLAGSSAGAAGSGDCTMNIACVLSPPTSTGDIKQDCVARINQFRTQCACLPPLQRWREAESCADQMAAHDAAANKAHAGFSGRICMPFGNGQNECPGYRSESSVIGGCLQQMWSEGPPPQSTCEGACFQMHGHFINMTNPRFTKVACGFHTTSSDSLWAVQNFSP